MKRADSLLIPLIRELGIEDGVRLAEIKKNWYDLFNEPLSYHMSPFLLSEGVIILNVDSPVWLQELNFYKEDIIKKLSYYGVKAVRFRIGRVSTRIESEVKNQKSEARRFSTEEISYIDDTISKITDPELRETIRRAIEKARTSKRTRLR